jgi:ATP-binding cassette subfamily B protein
VGETRAFKRVVVVDHGRIVEDGDPAQLEGTAGSKYKALLDAEKAVREELWCNPQWRQLSLEGGELIENARL